MAEEKVQPYNMTMCSPHIVAAFTSSGELDRDIVGKNIDTCCEHIFRSVEYSDSKLIVFPEFSITGYAPISYQAWVDAAFTFPGPETDKIAKVAQATGSYVVIQTPERHPAFPQRYFLSSVIITPSGDVGLSYRKNYSISLRTSPNDMFNQFVDVFGIKGLFPVLDTPLGKLGLCIGAEPHWPEAIRTLALNGAEVVLNSIANVHGLDYMHRAGAHATRGVRAFENMIYFGMANIPGEDAAQSKIYDFNGADIGHCSKQDKSHIVSEIDIQALRLARAKPGANLLAQIQTAIHPALENYPLWPKNCFPTEPAADANQLISLETESWHRLQQLQGKL